MPFEPSHSAALVYQIVHTAPPPLSRLRPGLDAELEALCLKALAKRPEDRFGSGEEMAAALVGWAAAAVLPRTSSAEPACAGRLAQPAEWGACRPRPQPQPGADAGAVPAYDGRCGAAPFWSH